MRDARLAGIAAASRLARKGRGYRRYFARAHRGNRSRIEKAKDHPWIIYRWIRGSQDARVCVCVSLPRRSAYVRRLRLARVNDALKKKKTATTLDDARPPRYITTHRARGISPRLRNAPATHISVEESY